MLNPTARVDVPGSTWTSIATGPCEVHFVGEASFDYVYDEDEPLEAILDGIPAKRGEAQVAVLPLDMQIWVFHRSADFRVFVTIEDEL